MPVTDPAHPPITGLTALVSDELAPGEGALLRAGGEGGTPLSSVGSPSQLDTGLAPPAAHLVEEGGASTLTAPGMRAPDSGTVARLLSPGAASLRLDKESPQIPWSVRLFCSALAFPSQGLS